MKLNKEGVGGGWKMETTQRMDKPCCRKPVKARGLQARAGGTGADAALTS